MYQSHWGLDETPFRTDLDPRFFYQGPSHEEALARLHFLVEQRRRMGLLLGEQGSGKSLLLVVFGREIRQQGLPVAQVNLLGVEPCEFPLLLAASLEMDLPRGTSPHVLWRSIDDRLAEYRYQHLRSVVLLDDADRAKPDVLAQVARLAQLQQGPDSPLTLVLAGRPERAGRLGDSLLERVELRIDLGLVGPDRHGELPPGVAFPGRGEVAGLRPAGHHAVARAGRRHTSPHHSACRPGPAGRRRPPSARDRRPDRRIRLPGVGGDRGVGASL